MRILIIGCGLILPILLFLFKYVLPALFEAALTNKKKEQKRIFKELINYPNELLMIAIGYTIPKTIEYLIVINNGTGQYNIVPELLWNIIFTIAVLCGIPFMVSSNKIIEKMYWAGKKVKAKWRCFFMYCISLITIIFSLILGV